MSHNKTADHKTAEHKTDDKKTNYSAQHTPLQLDLDGLHAARQDLTDGALTPAYGPWRDDVVKLLNGALATELV